MTTPLLPKKTTNLKGGLLDLYKLWSKLENVPQSPDYDMQGFYLGGLLGDPAAETAIDPSDMQLHFSDKWKLPNHPSFSHESMYSTSKDDPQWIEPAPYKKGTWARYSPKVKGLLNIDIPLEK